MAKITIPELLGNFLSVFSLNSRFKKIEDELNNKVLYRDNPGTEPNELKNDLDANNHNILNVNQIEVKEIVADNLLSNIVTSDPSVVLTDEAGKVKRIALDNLVRSLQSTPNITITDLGEGTYKLDAAALGGGDVFLAGDNEFTGSLGGPAFDHDLLNLMRSRIPDTTPLNLDALQTSGVYMDGYPPYSTGYPSDLGGDNGVAIVTVTKEAGGSSVIQQIEFIRSGRVFKRVTVNGTNWQPWKEQLVSGQSWLPTLRKFSESDPTADFLIRSGDYEEHTGWSKYVVKFRVDFSALNPNRAGDPVGIGYGVLSDVVSYSDIAFKTQEILTSSSSRVIRNYQSMADTDVGSHWVFSRDTMNIAAYNDLTAEITLEIEIANPNKYIMPYIYLAYLNSPYSALEGQEVSNGALSVKVIPL